MIPRQSIAHRFTRRARLENRWTAALAEPHPVRSLRLLLALTSEFDQHPKALAPLWVPFVDSVLRDGRAAVITGDDLAALEKTGAEVAGASGGRLTPDQAWLSLITLRDARREYAVVDAMLTQLYWSTGGVILDRPAIARELARRGARAEQHQAVYVHYLATIAPPAQEPAIVAVLSGCLTVGFEVNPAQLERGGNLADRLRAANIAIAGVDLALGYRSLLVRREPSRAALHFEAAWFADRSSWPALFGLLSAWVRTGDHDRIQSVLSWFGESAPALVGQLAELSATLRWLDQATVDGQPPTTAAGLAELPVRPEVGEWLDYAIGRLHLVEGDATAAARILVPLTEQYPEQPRWHYHAAWSLLLLDDRQGIRRRFDAARGAPDRWAIGCLLMEADPTAARAVADELIGGGLPAGAACIVEARAAFAQARRPRQFEPVRTGEVPLAEELEFLRTELGIWFGERNIRAMTEAMSSPAFHRLPLADQLLWSGLTDLPADRGRQLLAQAADKLGYSRAAVVLATLDAQDAGGRLGRLAHRTDSTIELIRAWHDVVTGDDDGATARLLALAARGEPRAHYALGGLRLGRATSRAEFTAAAGAYRAALVPGVAVPADAIVLLHCAELAGDPDASGTDCAEHWAHARHWPATSWAKWIVALAVLAGDPAAVAPDACVSLVETLEAASRPSEAAVVAVAIGLARLSLLTGDSDRADAVTELIGRLADRFPSPEVTRLLGHAEASAVRRGIASQLRVLSAVGALALAERALGEGDEPAAAGHLRVVADDGGLAARFCGLAADLLDDRPVDTVDITGLDVDSATGEAFRILVAAAVAKAEPGRGMDDLLPILRQRDLTGLVDLSHAIPVLCADNGRQQPPEYLVRLVRQALTNGGTGMSPLLLARCATVLGERETTKPWRAALAQDSAARTEYAAVLRHQAVAARRAGEDFRAVGCLLLAVRVLAGHPPDRLIPSVEDLPELRRRFRDGRHGLTNGQRVTANGNWAVTSRAFIDATARADESRTLLCFALLEHLVDAAESTGVELLARHLVLAVCVDRLVAHLFPAHTEVRERPGRHRVLEKVIEQDHSLLFSLLDGDRAAALSAWQEAMTAGGLAIDQLHALGVLYRERALADPAATDDLIVATTLWALLLSTAEFWQHLGERARSDEDELRTTIAEELWTAHATRGRQALAVGDEDSAGKHLRCLADCADGGTKLVVALRTFGIRYQYAVTENLLEKVTTIAGDALRDWIDDVLRAARNARDDPEAIAGLPEGSRANFEGGIDSLTPFLRLGVPVREVLRTGLEWYNSWRYDHSLREDQKDTIDQLNESADVLSDALTPLCAKGQGIDPANQVLAKHFIHRGCSRDGEAAEAEFEEALAWNPGNDNAQELLSEMLNRRAAKILTEVYTTNASFLKTISAILDAATIGLRAGARGAPARHPSRRPPRAACVKCGGSASSGRKVVIASLIHIGNTTKKARTEFGQFWADYRPFLCDGCESGLQSITDLPIKATNLLERALELDPNNEKAAEYLKDMRNRA